MQPPRPDVRAKSTAAAGTPKETAPLIPVPSANPSPIAQRDARREPPEPPEQPPENRLATARPAAHGSVAISRRSARHACSRPITPATIHTSARLNTYHS